MTLIAEDLLLLALHDEQGKKESRIRALEYGLVGCLLAELALLKKIKFQDNMVKIIDDTTTDDKLLDSAFQIISDPEQDNKIIKSLKNVHNGIKKLQEQLIDRLIKQKILYMKKDKFLGVFSRNRYPTQSPKIEIDIRTLITNVLLHDEHPEERTVLLISISKACEVLPVIFPNKDDRTIAKRRAEEITELEGIAQGIKEIINQINTAIITTIITTAVL